VKFAESPDLAVDGTSYEAQGRDNFYVIDPMGTSSYRLDIFFGTGRRVRANSTEYLPSLEVAQTMAREHDKAGPIPHRTIAAKDRAMDLCELQWVKMVGLGDRIYWVSQKNGVDYFLERLGTGSWNLRICMADNTQISDVIGGKKAARSVAGAFSRSYACTHSTGDEAWTQYRKIRRRVMARFEDPQEARNKAKNNHLTHLDAISEELDRWNEVVEANVDGWNGLGVAPPTEAGRIIQAIKNARLAIDGSGGPSGSCRG
jgi:hypothetical protein